MAKRIQKEPPKECCRCGSESVCTLIIARKKGKLRGIFYACKNQACASRASSLYYAALRGKLKVKSTPRRKKRKVRRIRKTRR